MSVVVHYIAADGTEKDFSAMCFAQLGKGACYAKNPEYWDRYEEFCNEKCISYYSGDNKHDAVKWYSRHPMSHIELRQSTTFIYPQYKASFMPQAQRLVKYLLEDSPFSAAYLSTYEDWVKGVVKIDINTVTAEMTLHACQWFRLAGQSATSFGMLMDADDSDPWLCCILAYLLPNLWKGDCQVQVDMGDNTVVPSYMDKRMITNPSELYEQNCINLSVYQLWGYPMNLLRMWSDKDSRSSNFVYDNLTRIRNKYRKSTTIQGIFTQLEVSTITDLKAFIQEVKKWASR